MGAVSEVRLTVAKTTNLGNYENVKIEVSVVVSRIDDQDDTAADMREEALEQVHQFLLDAYKDHVPQRKRGDQ